jgi:hypothetical protein
MEVGDAHEAGGRVFGGGAVVRFGEDEEWISFLFRWEELRLVSSRGSALIVIEVGDGRAGNLALGRWVDLSLPTRLDGGGFVIGADDGTLALGCCGDLFLSIWLDRGGLAVAEDDGGVSKGFWLEGFGRAGSDAREGSEDGGAEVSPCECIRALRSLSQLAPGQLLGPFQLRWDLVRVDLDCSLFAGGSTLAACAKPPGCLALGQILAWVGVFVDQPSWWQVLWYVGSVKCGSKDVRMGPVEDILWMFTECLVFSRNNALFMIKFLYYVLYSTSLFKKFAFARRPGKPQVRLSKLC